MRRTPTDTPMRGGSLRLLAYSVTGVLLLLALAAGAFYWYAVRPVRMARDVTEQRVARRADAAKRQVDRMVENAMRDLDHAEAELAEMSAAADQQLEAMRQDPLLVAGEGRQLTAGQAAALEQALKDRPDDLAARSKLLGFYRWSPHAAQAARAADKQAEHVFWFIENHPGNDSLTSLLPHLGREDGETFERAKALWLEQAERHSDDPQVLGNAANAFVLWDKEKARQLFEKARALEPQNPEWPAELAQLYHLQVPYAPTAERRKELAAKALAEQKRAVELSADPRDRLYHLEDVPEMALDAGRTDDAGAAAKELMELAARQPDAWNAASATHRAHIALGRAALQLGDVKAAVQHLGKAGEAKLASSRPDLTLARQLLERGERDAVVQYLKSVAKFWERGRDDV